MQILNMKTLTISLAFCVFTLCTMQVAADAPKFYFSEKLNSHWSSTETLFLAENEQEPGSGDLLIPDANEKEDAEKKCITVCDKWGRDCIINPQTGQRKCRRMCKSFGQECL